MSGIILETRFAILCVAPYLCTPKVLNKYAEVAQLVEHDLAKVGVAGSSLVFRSKRIPGLAVWNFLFQVALVAELVDAQDLKSCFPQRKYGFNSRLGHKCLPFREAFSFYKICFSIIPLSKQKKSGRLQKVILLS